MDNIEALRLGAVSLMEVSMKRTTILIIAFMLFVLSGPV
jgi:hypothetical protein